MMNGVEGVVFLFNAPNFGDDGVDNKEGLSITEMMEWKLLTYYYDMIYINSIISHYY